MKFFHKLRLILSVRNLLPFVYVFFVYGAATIAGFLLKFDVAYILTTPLGTISWLLFRDTLVFVSLWALFLFYMYLFYELVRGFLK